MESLFFQVHLWLLRNMIFGKAYPMKDILPYSQTAYQSAHPIVYIDALHYSLLFFGNASFIIEMTLNCVTLDKLG